jgi:PIN domain nuclease of toxin-antitoxin system
MRFLLDTHIFLWWLADDPTLPTGARALIADPTNELFVSAVSIWEVAIKSRLGKIAADVGEIARAVSDSGCRPLPFTLAHAAAVATLPDHHRDPFDRALIAQAQVEPLALLTRDEAMAAYGPSVRLV